ncbi:methionyl-tRNA synthetase [Carpediemonas membranifera]|uniref:Methionyl-tRNA synthetase n=1 Tax=Carpediemonas membranifera TaxID=201153 RepID=A0A8J6BF31_9EUKA|nr:methionyl-tRNA synthetase [Carpediemonas membranifera]|eukprot:KAG9396132.1 methionyl-tRNA synthetase [Carpediemonas membranifera]
MIVKTAACAEFNIHVGTEILVSYPCAIPLAKTALCELAIPEGSHHRTWDSTFFTIHPESRDDVNIAVGERSCPPIAVTAYHYDANQRKWVIIGTSADFQECIFSLRATTPKMYFQNVSDHTVVLDMVLHPKIEITKLSDELWCMYDIHDVAIGIAFADEDARYAFEYQISTYHRFHKATQAETIPKLPVTSTLFGIAVVGTRHDDSLDRGALVRSIVVVGGSPLIDALRPLVKHYVQLVLDGMDPKTALGSLITAANTATPAIPDRMPPPELVRYNRLALLHPRVDVQFTTPERVITGQFHEYPFPHESCAASLLDLHEMLGAKMFLVLNALLFGKKIIFHTSGPAAKVCNAVLSATQLVDPFVPSICNRAIPYACLAMSDDYLKKPNYILGVTNPIFRTHPEWYDLWVDIDSGEVTIMPDCRQVAIYASFDEDAHARLTQLTVEVAKRDGPNVPSAETATRVFMYQYVKDILEAATCVTGAAIPEYGLVRLNELSILSHIIGLRGMLTGNWVDEAVRRLRGGKCGGDQIQKILTTLAESSDKEMVQMLTLFPRVVEGIQLISSGLFSSVDEIRTSSYLLMQRVGQLPEGKPYIDDLNYFTLFHYERVKRKLG